MSQMPAAEIVSEAIQSTLKPPAVLVTIHIVRGTKSVSFQIVAIEQMPGSNNPIPQRSRITYCARLPDE